MLPKIERKIRRQKRVRARISWTPTKPRLAVFKSNTSIYAQLIDDTTGTTLCSASSLKIKKAGTKSEAAKKVWEEIAKLALKSELTQVVFDRGGFSYHGRVKALAEWAREGGLKF